MKTKTKTINLSIFLFFIFISCTDKEIQRINMLPLIINDSIYTVMPGDLLVNDKYLIWTDPFGKDCFFYILDKHTGKQIGGMGKLGLGPDEFVSPTTGRYFWNNEIFINDHNRGVCGYLSIDSFLLGKQYFKELKPTDDKKHLRRVEDNIYIGYLQDGANKPFEAFIQGNRREFGKYPIPEVKQHVGGYAVYDPEEKYFVQTSSSFPYIALYQLKEDNFELLWERKETRNYYEIRDGVIEFNRKLRGQGDVCISKDYIITLERDREFDDMDETTVGRDISKCPQTVFLYDFHSNLVKIVHLGMPAMRIAANRQSNTLYVIGAYPDYVIAKYELF